MTEWSHNSQIVMEKNPNYYDYENLGPDTITFKLMDNANAMLTAFQSGDLDFIEDVPVDEIPSLVSDGSLNIVPYVGTYYVCYNTEAAPFDDWRVRKAFTLAINSQYIVDNVTQTGQVPATGFVPSGSNDAHDGEDFRVIGGDYWTAPTTDEQYAANVAEAQQLLAEAGYPNGEGFPTVTYLYNTNDNHKKIAEALQQQWQTALGVNVKIENQDWSVFLQTRKDGNYQIARNGWIADYNDPICFLDMWMTGGGNNDAQYSNADYDALIKQAKSSSDPEVRMQAMHDAEDILIGQDWVLGPIYFYTQKYMLSDKVQGLYYTPLGYFFYGSITQK
jgi:oligopeptide transport system substrate-binding protein